MEGNTELVVLADKKDKKMVSRVEKKPPRGTPPPKRKTRKAGYLEYQTSFQVANLTRVSVIQIMA